MTKNILLRTSFAMLALGAFAGAAQASGQSPLADCYDQILGMCDSPDEISPYEQCIEDGFGLCDNQHPQPLVANMQLVFTGLKPDQKPIVERLVMERIERDRQLRTAAARDGNTGGDDDSGEGGSTGATGSAGNSDNGRAGSGAGRGSAPRN